MTYPSERLAYWYFRLNGFLTTENFIVHPDVGSDQRTDADILAVRFKHRVENIVRPMYDDPRVVSCDHFVNIIIAEITTRRCKLNGPWTDPEMGNMERVLGAIGCFDRNAIAQAAARLYSDGSWGNELACVRLFAVGEERAPLVIPEGQQLVWGEIIQFCIERFKEYRNQKSSVPQWTDDGKELQKLALKGDIAGIRGLFRLGYGGDRHA